MWGRRTGSREYLPLHVVASYEKGCTLDTFIDRPHELMKNRLTCVWTMYDSRSETQHKDTKDKTQHRRRLNGGYPIKDPSKLEELIKEPGKAGTECREKVRIVSTK